MATRCTYLYGSMGYGKSFLCWPPCRADPLKTGRVVYPPNCRTLLNAGFGSCVAVAPLLRFGDSPIQQQEFGDCEEVIRFCQQLRKNKVQLYFIIDQYNALDSEE